MRVFISRWFHRFARREGISDEALREAIARAEQGQTDAPLGGEVIKQRIGRPGQSRSKGYRAIVFFRRGERAFFIYGFSKSARANIDARETREFREAARHVLALTEGQLAELLRRGDFIEVSDHGPKQSR
ncbi:MAG TPA: type II toxin-antitoxin system RelE/ParE family toxin [Bryobacteraceae bacterium]|nr:type II toxin-antitoxin system RelE/ParE family toxin [Bryobacteraceae bacterium]